MVAFGSLIQKSLSLSNVYPRFPYKHSPTYTTMTTLKQQLDKALARREGKRQAYRETLREWLLIQGFTHQTTEDDKELYFLSSDTQLDFIKVVLTSDHLYMDAKYRGFYFFKDRTVTDITEKVTQDVTKYIREKIQ